MPKAIKVILWRILDDMKNKKSKNRVYVYNPKDTPCIDMRCGEWISADKIDFELENKLKAGKYHCIFLKEQNVFAHYMNRLRSLSKGTNTIVVIGVDNLIESLDVAQTCRLDIVHNKIWIDDVEINLNTMDLYSNVSEIMEYNLDKKEICYKPDYYYDARLAEIIVQGYNEISKYIQKPHVAVFRDDRRIWNSGFVFPSDFFDLFSVNRDRYYELMEQYCEVLFSLLDSCETTLEYDELVKQLIPHYTYSILFSLIAPDIVTMMAKCDIIATIDAVSAITPFKEKVHKEEMKQILRTSLENLRLYLISLKRGEDSERSFNDIYKIKFFPNNPWVAMLFVTNILQDIRRGVVNEVRRKYSWFDKICGHRKKIDNIYERI